MISILLVGLPSPASATVINGGTIASSTTWTLEGSPYILQGDVTIAAGATTLTIDPGVVVQMAATDSQAAGQSASQVEITVLGTLDVNGTLANPVTIEPLSSGSQWHSLIVNGNGSATVENLSMIGGGLQTASGASAAINDTEFTDNSTFSLSGTTEITDSTFTETASIEIEAGSTTFTGNIVRESSAPAALHMQGGSANISQNLFEENENTAVRFDVPGSFFYNALLDNSVGLETALPSGQVLTPSNNAFLRATSFDWKVRVNDGSSTSADYTGSNNYWGDPTPTNLGQRIHDESDDPSLGNVNVDPVSNHYPDQAFVVRPPLNWAKAGTGEGIVTLDPVGFAACGNNCFEYYFGTLVELMAEPAAGSVFSGWSEICSGTGPCALSITDPTTLTANFKLRSQTTASINKKSKQLVVTGSVSPKHPGHQVVVRLLKRRSGKFVQIRTKKPLLSKNSRFSTSFSRPGAGTCRIKVSFSDSDQDHVPSAVAKTFNC